jgi:tetratricopeptide (TPR) repeat protein
MVLSARSNALWSVGENASALVFAERAFEMAMTVEDVTVRVWASSDCGMICRTLGDLRRARTLFEATVRLLQGDLLYQRFGRSIHASVNARVYLAMCLGEMGEFEQAKRLADEAIVIADKVQSPGSIMGACLGACYVLLRRGNFHQAAQHLEGFVLSRGAGLAAWAPTAAAMLGYTYAMTGRIADAVSLVEQGVERAHHFNRTVEAGLRTYLVKAYLLAERYEDAHEAAARTLDLARQRAERGVEAQILYLIGEIVACSEPAEIEMAHTHFNQAAAMAREHGMRPLVAHCHLGLAKLSRRTGKPQEALHHLTTATTMYRGMEMNFWLEQAKAESKELA